MTVYDEISFEAMRVELKQAQSDRELLASYIDLCLSKLGNVGAGPMPTAPREVTEAFARARSIKITSMGFESPAAITEDGFDPLKDSNPSTAAQALALARAWAEGKRSWTNLYHGQPDGPQITAVVDAQEVVKWTALAVGLAQIEKGAR